MTEQGFHNDLESSISITERSSKFLKRIYIELLRIIKPIEMPGSYENNDAQSPRTGSTEA